MAEENPVMGQEDDVGHQREGQQQRDWSFVDVLHLSMLGLRGSIHLEDRLAGSTLGLTKARHKEPCLLP